MFAGHLNLFIYFLLYQDQIRKPVCVNQTELHCFFEKLKGKMATFQTNKCFLLMQFTEFSVLLKNHVEIKCSTATGKTDRKNSTNSTHFSQSQCWIITLTKGRQRHGFSLEVMEMCTHIWTLSKNILKKFIVNLFENVFAYNATKAKRI